MRVHSFSFLGVCLRPVQSKTVAVVSALRRMVSSSFPRSGEAGGLAGEVVELPSGAGGCAGGPVHISIFASPAGLGGEGRRWWVLVLRFLELLVVFFGCAALAGRGGKGSGCLKWRWRRSGSRCWWWSLWLREARRGGIWWLASARCADCARSGAGRAWGASPAEVRSSSRSISTGMVATAARLRLTAWSSSCSVCCPPGCWASPPLVSAAGDFDFRWSRGRRLVVLASSTCIQCAFSTCICNHICTVFLIV